MTTYLLKSGLCLLLVLGFYKIWLENERMHRFNRFYLLGGLLCSALVPLLSFQLWPTGAAVPLFEPASVPAHGEAVFPVPTNSSGALEPAAFSYGWGLYGAITAVMLGRFALNLCAIFRKITAHSKQPYRGATLVLLAENTLPHTFLHCIFVSGTAYRRGEIKDELMAHELAHARQRHSLDVLLVEALLCFGWFNPLLFWCKRAIQLNHEFLADEAVLRNHANVTDYQRLLLDKLALTPPVLLTSSFSAQTTKQRLLMMTKHTPRAKAWLIGSGATLLLGALTLLLGTTTKAQVALPSSGVQKPVKQNPQPETDVAKMERLYGDKRVIMTGRNAPVTFSKLSDSEKKRVELVPPLPRQVPTEGQLTDWKNSKKYGVWIDEKRVPNSRLNEYTAQDFGSYFVSKLEKNAINYGKHYFQIDLMTQPAYEKYLVENAKNPLLVLRRDPTQKGK